MPTGAFTATLLDHPAKHEHDRELPDGGRARHRSGMRLMDNGSTTFRVVAVGWVALMVGGYELGWQ